MLIFRKILSFLLALVLIVTLVLVSLFTSLSINIKNKEKVDNWIDKPAIYKVLINKLTTEANDSINDQYNIQGLSSFITQNVSSVYPESTFNSNVSTILNSNYSWLEGKSTIPNFSINFASPRANLANKVGNYTLNYAENLPLCTDSQLIELENSGPSSVSCWPSTLNPQTVSDQIKSEILNSDLFINGTYLTASSVNISGLNDSQPYYLKYSKVPNSYKWSMRMPYLLGALVVLVLICLVFLYPRRKGALKLISWSLLIAGLVVLASSSVINNAFNKLVNKVSTNATFSEFKVPVDSFISSFKNAIEKMDKDFALVYIIVAVIALLSIFTYTKIKNRQSKGAVYVRPGGEGGI